VHPALRGVEALVDVGPGPRALPGEIVNIFGGDLDRHVTVLLLVSGGEFESAGRSVEAASVLARI
jgi:hypothetical protein